MPQSLVEIYVHVVFSTKNRSPLLKDPAAREEMHRYLAKICNNLECAALEVNGYHDHVHLLVRLGKTISIAELIRELKRASSLWFKGRFDCFDFYWQSGYGAFSIGPFDVPRVREYVQTQEKRHQAESFQTEFRRLCEKYGVQIDERYVWD
jgi:REP element-mobilizing transposase RayT